MFVSVINVVALSLYESSAVYLRIAKKYLLSCLLLQACFISVCGAQPPVESGSRFRMGVYYPSIKNVANRVDFEVAINFWLQELKQSVHFQSASARLFDNISDMRMAFDNGELDFILAPPLSLAKHFNRGKLADGFVGIAMDGKDYGTVLLVRDDKRIANVKDLAGKRLLMPEHDELAEMFLDTLTIKSTQHHYQKVFSSIHSKDKISSIVLALFFNQADAGVTFNEIFQLMVDLNPQIKNSVKILASFPTKSPNYGYFSNDYPKAVRDDIADIITGLNKQVRAQQILNDLRMASLIKCPVEALEPFDKLIREHQSLQKGIKK